MELIEIARAKYDLDGLKEARQSGYKKCSLQSVLLSSVRSVVVLQLISLSEFLYGCEQDACDAIQNREVAGF